jgi:peptide/nickel transport system substrate-binding protein/oligopeptide transport system substrate-binding protein
LLALLLAGCATADSTGPQLAANQTFIFPLAHAASFNDLVLDPANTPDIYSGSVVGMIYGHLVTTDYNLNVIPDMATNWDISSDGKQYTFHLQPNLHFSDGTPLTSKDFAYSIDRALDPKTCVPIFGAGCKPRTTSLVDIVGYADRVAGRIPSDIDVGLFAPDAQTFIIKLDSPVAYFLEAMTTSVAIPVERTFIEKIGVDYKDHTDWTAHLDKGGCSGPFIIQSYGDGKTLTFAPNPFWYGHKLTLSRVVRPIVPDLTNEYTGYQQGEYDYTDVPVQEYQGARDQADFREIGLLSEQFLGLNELSPPFNDLNVRMAFALALNKQLIADHILNGASLPTNHIVPQGQPGFNPNLTAPGGNTHTVTGDVNQAQTLIKGYFATCDCKVLPVTLTYPNDAKRTSVAQAMITIWQTVLSGSWGTVTVTPDPVSFQTLVNTDFTLSLGNPGPLQMWLIGLSAAYPDPHNWLNGVFSPTSPLNVFNYRDDSQFQAWSLMQRADVERDKEMRLSLYNQAEQQLVNAALEIPYAQEKGIWRIKPYIQGYNPTALQAIADQDWANVVVLAH